MSISFFLLSLDAPTEEIDKRRDETGGGLGQPVENAFGGERRGVEDRV